MPTAPLVRLGTIHQLFLKSTTQDDVSGLAQWLDQLELADALQMLDIYENIRFYIG